MPTATPALNSTKKRILGRLIMAQQVLAQEILVFPRENRFWNLESQWQAE